MVNARQSRALFELVAHLAQTIDERQRSPRVLSPVEDMPIGLVRDHGLASLAYRAGYDCFRDDFAKNVVLAQTRAKVADDAVDALTSADIEVILAHAASYGSAIYDDGTELESGQVDLLVRRAQLISAQRVLAGRQFAVVPVVHAGLGEGPFSIPAEDLWARALPAIEREDAAQRLDPTDEALLHLLLIAHDGLSVPTVRYVEAQRLLRRRGCNRLRVMQRASSLGLSRAARAAASMTSSLAMASEAVSWPDRRMRVLPRPPEILSREPCRRSLQMLRRAALLQDPRTIAQLLAGGLIRRMRSD